MGERWLQQSRSKVEQDGGGGGKRDGYSKAGGKKNRSQRGREKKCWIASVGRGDHPGIEPGCVCSSDK